VQSLADRAEARVGLPREAANADAEVAVAREATLQAQIEAAQVIQCMKETMVRQAVTPSFKGKTECNDHVCARIKLHTCLDIMNTKISATRIKSYYKP
jgi:hypothetical protein